MHRKFEVAFAILAITVLSLAIACSVKAEPKLSEGQKLEIRQAQVDLLLAQQKLQQSAEYQAMSVAQNHMNEILKKAMDELKINPADYQLDSDLNLKPLKPATPAPAPKK